MLPGLKPKAIKSESGLPKGKNICILICLLGILNPLAIRKRTLPVEALIDFTSSSEASACPGSPRLMKPARRRNAGPGSSFAAPTRPRPLHRSQRTPTAALARVRSPAELGGAGSRRVLGAAHPAGRRAGGAGRGSSHIPRFGRGRPAAFSRPVSGSSQAYDFT